MHPLHPGPALAGAGPKARLQDFGAGPLWAVLYDVIVLSQPCYDRFEKMAYIRGGQLIWLEGHLEKVAFSGGPYLLMEIDASFG